MVGTIFNDDILNTFASLFDQLLIRIRDEVHESDLLICLAISAGQIQKTPTDFRKIHPNLTREDKHTIPHFTRFPKVEGRPGSKDLPIKGTSLASSSASPLISPGNDQSTMPSLS